MSARRTFFLAVPLALAMASYALYRAGASDSTAPSGSPSQTVDVRLESLRSGGAPELPIQRLQPYPRGRWRLASPGALSRTMLWTSHILIRYPEAASQE